MRSVTVIGVLPFLAALAPLASANVLNFGPTSQNETFTGLGNNSAGDGTFRITFGSCVPSGGNTVCTLSAPFTGLGAGGTISFVYTYPGTGSSPITGTTTAPGGNQVSYTFASGNLVVTVAVTNGPTLTFSNPNFGFQFAGLTCTGVSTCTIPAVGAASGATLSGPVSGTFDTTPSILSVISAGSFGAFHAMAPGSWIEIYGNNLDTNAQNVTWAAANFSGVNAPTTLNNVTVAVAGIPAYIDYVSPTQVNVQVPAGVPSGIQSVIVTTQGGSNLPYPVQVNTVEPGMLAPPVFQINGIQYIVALFPDGVTYVLPPGVTNQVATRRAQPGNTIILYGIGFGPVTPNIPPGQIAETSSALSGFVISFAGTPAQVTYAGLTPGYVGLYQFNVVVPNVAASDAVPVGFALGSFGGGQTMVTAIGN